MESSYTLMRGQHRMIGDLGEDYERIFPGILEVDLMVKHCDIKMNEWKRIAFDNAQYW